MKKLPSNNTGIHKGLFSLVALLLAGGYARSASLVQHESFPSLPDPTVPLFFERFDTMDSSPTPESFFAEIPEPVPEPREWVLAPLGLALLVLLRRQR